jgi:DNA-binding XRE family transcriptional regulator
MRFIDGMTQLEAAKKLQITKDQFVSAEKQTLKILRMTGAKTKISCGLSEYINEIS